VRSADNFNTTPGATCKMYKTKYTKTVICISLKMSVLLIFLIFCVLWGFFYEKKVSTVMVNNSTNINKAKLSAERTLLTFSL
jgi:hypothetical protein